MSDYEQQTFGNAKFNDCSHTTDECGKLVEGEKCPNNAVLRIFTQSEIKYRCAIHGRKFALRKIGYNE